MSGSRLSKLGPQEDLREVLYHIAGILEADEKLRALLDVLNETFDSDLEKSAGILSLLEVEINEHLGYHHKAIKRPLATFLRKTYKALEKAERNARRSWIVGLMSMWVVTGDTMSAVGMSPVDASWTLAAVGDFNGDGKADLFWRHTSGQNFQWQINGSSINAIQMPPADPPYQVAGCGDFTGDGKADLLWRHDVYGWNWVWQIDGGLINPTQLPAAPDTTWRVQSPK